MSSQKYDYFLILDFEATCIDNKGEKFRNEIIEFPIVVLDPNTGEIVSEFREYVKPILNRKLSAFCTSLTGIQQDTVDTAEEFPTVYQNMKCFLKTIHHENQLKNIVFVTCGDWDLQHMLPSQFEISGMTEKIPTYFRKWIDIKVPFEKTFPNVTRKDCSMVGMLNYLNLNLLGRHHSGLDDSRNTARIVYELIKVGTILDITSSS